MKTKKNRVTFALENLIKFSIYFTFFVYVNIFYDISSMPDILQITNLYGVTKPFRK